LPRWLRTQARFEAADQVGEPHRSAKENVVAFTRDSGVDDVARVLMLAHPRTGRRAVRLPGASRRARPSPGRQGVLRLPVPPGLRPLPDPVLPARAAGLLALRDSALIRWHGIALWLRRLPVL
jgi:DUF1365 family protein